MKKEVVQAAVTAVALTVAGLLMGLLWCWLAPRVPVVGDTTSGKWVVYLKDSEGEQSVAIDGTFVLLGLAFGVVSAGVLFLLRRRGGVPLVVGLAVGAVLGSVVAWRLGVALGPGQDVVARAREAGKGVTFAAPLKLSAKGALLAWPLGALLVHLGLTALFGPRDPEPYPAHGPYGPYPGNGAYAGNGVHPAGGVQPGNGPYGPYPAAGADAQAQRDPRPGEAASRDPRGGHGPRPTGSPRLEKDPRPGQDQHPGQEPGPATDHGRPGDPGAGPENRS